MKIVTLTINPTIDKNSAVDHIVAGKKMRCDTPVLEPGGGGINVSRAIKKLGGQSRAFFPSAGTYGALLQDLLDEEQIEYQAVDASDMIRENINIYEKNSGEQYRFIMPGPKLQKEDWLRCFLEIGSLQPYPDYIVASGSLPPGLPESFYSGLAKLGRDLEARVIIDTSGEPLQHAVKEGVFLAKPNMNEIKNLVDAEIEDEQQIAEAVQDYIKDTSTEIILVSLGIGGALKITKDDCQHFRSPTVSIKSRVGAGDSMVAGVVLSLSRGFSLNEAIEYGICAGASAVMTPGTALCNKSDTDRLYRNFFDKS